MLVPSIFCTASDIFGCSALNGEDGCACTGKRKLMHVYDLSKIETCDMVVGSLELHLRKLVSLVHKAGM
jgi:hypothetical protein